MEHPMHHSMAFMTVAIMLTLSSGASAQYTISDAIASGPGASGRERFFGGMAEARPMSLEEMTNAVTVVLDARLDWLRTYPSDDDQFLLTDFAVTPLRIHAGTVQSNVATPGAAIPFVLTTQQGTLVRNGVTIRGGIHGFEDLTSGWTYLLFLRPFGREPGRHQLYNYSAFDISGPTMRPLVREGMVLFRDWISMPYGEAVQRIAAIAASK
jgi:hypothetical protein